MSEKQRTLRQNRSLHKMFENLAQELNDAGLERKVVLAKAPEVPWTKESVKENLWRPIMMEQLLKQSTTELTTKDIDQVLQTLQRFLAENFGLVVDWPSIESLMMNERTQ